MTYIYTTEGGWDIEVEYDYHKGTTPPGGNDPEDVTIHYIKDPFGENIYPSLLPRFCGAFKIDIEDIESQIRDENL